MKTQLNNHSSMLQKVVPQKKILPKIMGILNVTPDSFSDGGKHIKPKQAIDHAIQMVKHGASIIDVGGESTRPGAKKVSTQEQVDRVIPVIEGLRNSSTNDIIISIDTTDYDVAKAALAAGANWINDISAGEDSDRMIELAASYKVPIILMHRKGTSDRMQDDPYYENVCLEVKEYLQDRAQVALNAGVNQSNIIVDPGIGFGKLLSHNLQLLADLESLTFMGYSVLLGASRKRFIGEICNENNAGNRVSGTCSTTALGVNAGVQFFRVHDVFENKQAMDVAWAVKQAGC